MKAQSRASQHLTQEVLTVIMELRKKKKGMTKMTPSTLVWKLGLQFSKCVPWMSGGSQRPFQGDQNVTTIFTIKLRHLCFSLC